MDRAQVLGMHANSRSVLFSWPSVLQTVARSGTRVKTENTLARVPVRVHTVLMKPTDPIRATPVTLEEGTTAFRIEGHPAAMTAFLESLDGARTDYDETAAPRDSHSGVFYVWPIFAATTRDGLAEELRQASDRSGIDLVIEPDLATADTDRPAPMENA
jgi:hypothetical protein